MLLFSKSIKVLSFLAVAGVSLGSVAKAEILFDQMTNYNPSIISSSWYAPDGADGDAGPAEAGAHPRCSALTDTNVEAVSRPPQCFRVPE